MLLEANESVTSNQFTNFISTLKDQCNHEDFRPHVKFYENDSDKGIETDIQDMKTDFHKKFENLVK